MTILETQINTKLEHLQTCLSPTNHENLYITAKFNIQRFQY